MDYNGNLFHVVHCNMASIDYYQFWNTTQSVSSKSNRSTTCFMDFIPSSLLSSILVSHNVVMGVIKFKIVHFQLFQLSCEIENNLESNNPILIKKNRLIIL